MGVVTTLCLNGTLSCVDFMELEFEWGFDALSASEAIFRSRAYRLYSHNLFSPVMMIT